MARNVVSSFSNLVEAQIACGALRSSGFDAEVLDQNVGGILPPNLMGGFRLVVPEGELAQARMALTSIKAQAG